MDINENPSRPTHRRLAPKCASTSLLMAATAHDHFGPQDWFFPASLGHVRHESTCGKSTGSAAQAAPLKALQPADPGHQRANPVFAALSPPLTANPTRMRLTAALQAVSSAYLTSHAITEIVRAFVEEEDDAAWGRLHAGWSL